MKQCLSLFLVLVMLLSLCACGHNTTDEKDAETSPKDTSSEQDDISAGPAEPVNANAYIALITDFGNIDDRSFNQSCWEAVVDFAEKNGAKYNYYRPAENSSVARAEAINKAIEDGATVCVCPGNLFEETLYSVQYQFPDVQFLLLDGEPHDVDYNYDTAPNVHCIIYKEEESGYLAGYAAVMDGMTQLGFIGGMAIDSVMRYGYGFVQGADAAAQELGKDITINYWYANTFLPNDTIYNTAYDWYTNETQVIFACGGSLGSSVIKAAQELGTYVIGVDSDQHYISDAVITSAMKQLYSTCLNALEDLKNNNWVWSEEYSSTTAVLGADSNAIALPTSDESWNFSSFTVEAYKKILSAIAADEVAISNDVSAVPSVGEQTTVNYLE